MQPIRNTLLVLGLFTVGIFLQSGCTSRCGWLYQDIEGAGPQFNCCRLSHVPSIPCNGIALEFQKGCYGIVGYASILARSIPSTQPLPVTVCIGEHIFSFSGYVEKGNQRVLLPDATTKEMIKGLACGEKIKIAFAGFYSEFEAETALDLFRKL